MIYRVEAVHHPLPEQARSDVYFVAGTTAVALFVTTPLIFFAAYAFNDFPGWQDHVSFLARTGVVVAAVGALSGFGIHASRPMRLRRAVCGAVGVSTTVLLTASAGYAFLSMLPVLDPAVGSTATDLACAWYGIVLSLSAAACGWWSWRLVGSDG